MIGIEIALKWLVPGRRKPYTVGSVVFDEEKYRNH